MNGFIMFSQLASKLKLTHVELLGRLSKQDKLQSFILVSSQDNSDLSNSGFLKVPKLLFRKLEIVVASEMGGEFKPLKIDIIHTKIGEIDDGDTYFKTFEQCFSMYDDATKGKLPVVSRNTLGEEAQVVFLNIRGKLTPLPFKNKEILKWHLDIGNYFRILIPSMNERSSNTGEFIDNKSLPDWAGIVGGPLTNTTKLVTPDNILIKDDSFLEEYLLSVGSTPIEICDETLLGYVEKFGIDKVINYLKVHDEEYEGFSTELHAATEAHISVFIKKEGPQNQGPNYRTALFLHENFKDITPEKPKPGANKKHNAATRRIEVLVTPDKK